MSVTEELRGMLDDLGVEWEEIQSMDRGHRITRWKDELGRYVSALDSGGTKYFIDFYWGPTPQQAIEATLGRGTCRNVHEPPRNTTFWYAPHFKCSECGATHVSMDYVYYCPNCGREVVEEEDDE